MRRKRQLRRASNSPSKTQRKTQTQKKRHRHRSSAMWICECLPFTENTEIQFSLLFTSVFVATDNIHPIKVHMYGMCWILDKISTSQHIKKLFLLQPEKFTFLDSSDLKKYFLVLFWGLVWLFHNLNEISINGLVTFWDIRLHVIKVLYILVIDFVMGGCTTRSQMTRNITR